MLKKMTKSALEVIYKTETSLVNFYPESVKDNKQPGMFVRTEETRIKQRSHMKSTATMFLQFLAWNIWILIVQPERCCRKSKDYEFGGPELCFDGCHFGRRTGRRLHGFFCGFAQRRLTAIWVMK
jgi:hypothetical protein